MDPRPTPAASRNQAAECGNAKATIVASLDVVSSYCNEIEKAVLSLEEDLSPILADGVAVPGEAAPGLDSARSNGSTVRGVLEAVHERQKQIVRMIRNLQARVDL